MLGIDESLGLAVAALLVAIGFDRVAPEVPDDCRGAKADDKTRVLKAPANVDIITGSAVNRIKAAKAKQCLAAECHVAAGNVLGDLIVEQDMGRATGRHGDR